MADQEPIRIQAEDLALEGFQTQNIDAADEGSVIRLRQDDPGTASVDLATLGISAGVHSIAVTFFDESDGVSTIDVQINGVSVGTIIMDQDGGGSGSQAENIRTVTLEGIDIPNGAILTLVGIADAGEQVRIDYVEVTPTGDPTPGPNLIVGTEMRDSFVGTDGDDQIEGLGETDFFMVSEGNDILNGGEGFDVFQTTPENPNIPATLPGTSFLIDLRSGTASYTLPSGENYVDQLISIEGAWGASEADTIYGDDNNNGLEGRDGNDSLFAGGGDDYVYGGNGDDVIEGGAGVDFLYGDDGNDIITGGLGNDYILGDVGADLIIFRIGDGTDFVDTFDTREDVLDVSDFGLTASEVVSLVQRDSFDPLVGYIDFGNGDRINFTLEAEEALLTEANFIGINSPPPDPLRLSLTTSDDQISEGESTVVTLSRTGGDLSTSLLVILVSASDEITFPTQVTIPENQTSVTFTVSGVDDGLVDGDQLTLIATSVQDSNANTANLTIEVLDVNTLPPPPPPPPQPSGDPIRVQAEDMDLEVFRTQNIDAADAGAVIRIRRDDTGTASTDLGALGITAGEHSIAVTFFDESDGVSTIDVQIAGVTVGSITMDQDGGGNGAQAENIRTVTLDGIDIPDGATLALVGTADAGEQVRIDYVEITPTGGPVETTLRLSAEQVQFNETESTLATITRTSEDISSDLVVTLVDDNPGQISFPETVTILAGQTEASFTVSGVDDGLADGNQGVAITATAPGALLAGLGLFITDADIPAVRVTIETQFLTEGVTYTALAERNTADVSEDLLVNLAVGDTSELSAPSSIVIPAGQSSITFQVEAILDDEVDGQQITGINASASGYAGSGFGVFIDDADVSPPPPPPPPGPNEIFGTEGDDIIFGTEDDDAIYGLAGDDFISDEGGNDIVFGGAGDDSIYSALGDDQLDGGAGNDDIYLADGADRIVFAPGNELDVVNNFDPTDDLIDVTQYGLTATEALALFQGSGRLSSALYLGNGDVLVLFNVLPSELTEANITGLAAPSDPPVTGSLQIVGTDDEDSLIGTAGNDNIIGFAGSDTLMGLAGDDVLDSQSGLTTYIGGTGNDVILTGSGIDTIVFSLGDGVDEVYQFDAGQDLIDVTGLGLTASVALSLAQQADGARPGTILDFGGGQSIFLFGISSSALTEANFIGVSPPPPPPPPSGDPVRVQAEDMDLEIFTTQNINDADEGAVIRNRSDDPGTASVDLASVGISAGTHSISVTFFDESDGVSTIDVQIDGVSVGSIIMDQDGGGSGSQAENIRTATLEGIDIPDGATLTLVGYADAGEQVRIDYVEITPTDSALASSKMADPTAAAVSLPDTFDFTGLSSLPVQERSELIEQYRIEIAPTGHRGDQVVRPSEPLDFQIDPFEESFDLSADDWGGLA